MEEQYKLLLEDKEALKKIRGKFKIDEDRFICGLEYVGHTLDATMSKTKAYSLAFKVDAATAGRVSARFHRAKWIQELIAYLRPEDNTLYMSEIKRIIGKGMEIVNDPASSDRNKIDAMKALQPYIRAEKKATGAEEMITESTGMSLVQKLTDNIALLAQAGKMVNEHGEIIDVQLVE